jgi:CRISPR-associated protein Cas5h
MRCIIFDVHGEYAHFKKPYSSASPVSFPFPPPTAVMGLLGAIVGYGKQEYHERLGWQSIRIGIRLLKPIQVFSTAINLLHTKNGFTDAYFRPKANNNSHTRMPFEFIKSPAYRLYVAELPEEAASRLVENLTRGQSVYTPVLGLASCLAEVEWVGEEEAQPMTAPEWETNTVVPISEKMKIDYDDDRRYHRFRVPAIMDSERIVHRYQEVIVTENTKSIRGKGGDKLFFKVHDETIAIFPNLSTFK